MARANWGLVDEFDQLRAEMDKVFNSFFEERPRVRTNSRWIPPVDILEGKDAIHLFMELPGVRKEDVAISVQDETITIKGGKHRDSESSDEQYLVNERRYGSFERSFALPSNVNRDKIDASLKDGILKVTLAKVKESEPKKIEIKVA